MTTLDTLRGVGLGWRPELSADLLREPHVVDFIEVIAERCFVSPENFREARALANLWPVIPHGVKLSLGSAEGLDLERARRLATLARSLKAPVVTEHVAFTRAGGRDIGHLTPLPRTRTAVSVLARNVSHLKRVLPDIPLLLENVAWTLRWPDDEMSEGDFYTEVVERTGCDLLLDVANLYANALNAGLDPHLSLRSYPLERVRMVHIAGGVLEDGFYFDTHAHATPPPVFELLETLFRHTGPLPVVLERDARFPPFHELREEISSARKILGAVSLQTARSARHAVPSAFSLQPVDGSALAVAQKRLAELLTLDPAPPVSHGFDAQDIARSRVILNRKRVDSALPLLPRLSRHGDDIVRFAFDCVVRTPRPASGVAIFDAFRIAMSAREQPRFADDACHDLLVLRARFSLSARDGTLTPRWLPFWSRKALSAGRVLQVWKGLGRRALLFVRGPMS